MNVLLGPVQQFSARQTYRLVAETNADPNPSYGLPTQSASSQLSNAGSKRQSHSIRIAPMLLRWSIA